MCFTVSAKAKVKELNQRYNAINETPELHQVFHKLSGFNPVAMPIKDFPKLPVLTSNDNKMFTYMQWGLIPFWTNPLMAKQFYINNLNAKSETIFEKKSFAPSLKSKRCIIPITGFFESRECNKVNYPYFIKLKNESIFSLAGIYDTWKDPDSGSTIKSFSIITTEANPLMAKIHNKKIRMPVILSKEKEMLWIAPELTESNCKELLQPISDSVMEAHTVDKKVNNTKIDTNYPEIINEVIYPELD